MQDSKPRRTIARTGYYWDKTTLEQRRVARLNRLESENYTALPDFDKQLLSSLKKGPGRPRASLPGTTDSVAVKRVNRKETRLLAMQRQSLADLMAKEMEQNEVLDYHACIVKADGRKGRQFCSICGYWGVYTCVDCGMRYCSLSCKTTHADTRCLKHVS